MTARILATLWSDWFSTRYKSVRAQTLGFFSINQMDETAVNVLGVTRVRIFISAEYIWWQTIVIGKLTGHKCAVPDAVSMKFA